MRNKPPTLPDKEHCTGCRVCRDVCKKHAIEMVADKHGFYYPVVNEEKCIKCERCEKTCPVLNEPIPLTERKDALVGTHKNQKVLEQSASGGAFSAIIHAWHPDAICGVRWNGFYAVNDIAYDDIKAKLFSKSKYILSDTNEIYKKAALELKARRRVIFSGSPCQLAAFRNYLGTTDLQNLLLVDIVCHGAPSAQILKMHLSELEEQIGKKISSWTFRDKTQINGIVSSRSARVDFDDGSWQHFEIGEDAYLRLYYERAAYREACGKCPFAKSERVSDITICDAHHIEELYPDMTIEKGASTILFHSDKGFSLLPEIQFVMDLREANYDWIVDHNEQLCRPTTIHPKTDCFFQMIDSGEKFEKSVKIAMHRSLMSRAIGKMKRIMKV